MSKLKATPGPYIRERTTIYKLEHRDDYHEDGSPFFVNRFQAHVSGVGKDRGAPPEELEATAQLFAASWDMYEALEDARKAISNAIEVVGSRKGDPEFATLAKVEAALAKARGEQ